VRLVALAVLLLGGCPRPAPPPNLDGTWPAKAGDYQTTVASWTRSGEINANYQLIMRAHATILSPEWRAALVDHKVRAGKLGADGRERLEEEQRIADESAWEVEIEMSTWDRRENDLDRGERSVWRVVLVDADGHEVLPTEIVRDKRSDGVLRAEFPRFDDFSKAYIARFPKTARILGPGVEKVGLRISSSRGGVVMTWSSR
jgi:hypothetical protein